MVFWRAAEGFEDLLPLRSALLPVIEPKLHHPGVTSESLIIRKYLQARPGSNFASARHTVWNLGAGGRRVRKFAAAAQRAATCNEARRSRIPIPCRQAQLRAACKGACVSKPYQFSSVQFSCSKICTRRLQVTARWEAAANFRTVWRWEPVGPETPYPSSPSTTSSRL